MAAINKGGVNAQKAAGEAVFPTDLHNRLNDVLDALDGTDSTDITLAGSLTCQSTLAVTGAQTFTGAITTSSHGTLQSAEHGPGAIGTAFAPRTYRRTENGHIITEIHVDLTGLACKGDAAGDAIGLAAGGAAYIGRYVTSTYGIVYRIEMICLETPGQGTATITTDINLGAEDASATAYDGAVDDTVIDAGAQSAGMVVVTNIPHLTANDYLYLVEGDTAATTGVYNAGMFIIRLYGHAVLA